jgi:hypothetical protein
MDVNPRQLWSIRDITELARCLKRGDTIADAASLLYRDEDQVRRDEDQVRQKADDLGLVEPTSKRVSSRSVAGGIPGAMSKSSRTGELRKWTSRT